MLGKVLRKVTVDPLGNYCLPQKQALLRLRPGVKLENLYQRGTQLDIDSSTMVPTNVLFLWISIRILAIRKDHLAE